MKVFSDYHHGDLWFSLHRLFEERLGWELYRPIGLDWFKHGYWKIAEPYNNAPDTIDQFLGMHEGKSFDPYRFLNGDKFQQPDGTWRVKDTTHGYYHKAIEFQTFCDTKFDLILSCYGPPHDLAFDTLRDKHQPHAKRLTQMGNWKQQTHSKHVLYSCPFTPRADQHALYYHQEIDRDLFYPTPPDPDTQRIYSFVNLLPFAELYHRYRVHIPEVEWRAYGAAAPDGPLRGAAAIAPKMQLANLGWHLKPFDGFGHTAMDWMGSGRAVITRMDEVQEYGWDAPRLFVPNETCIALGSSREDNCAAIRLALEPDENQRLCENAARRFESVCNYDAEFEQIKRFMEEVMT